MLKRIKLWLFTDREIKHCKHCCLTCEWFEDCIKDIENEGGVRL